MKKISFIILTSLFCVQSLAQTYWDSSRADKFLTYGIRAGANFSKAYIQDGNASYGFRPGYQVGVQFDVNLCRSFSVSTMLSYIEKGYEKDFKQGNLFLFNIKEKVSYIEIPLLASYRIPLSDATQFQINLGPYFSYGLYSKFVMQNDEYRIEENSLNSKIYGARKKTDVGICYGCAVTLSKFYLGVNYERSIVNLSSTSDASLENASVIFSIGYNLN